MLKDESQQKIGLSFGIGAYPTSFYKTWILGGFIYWGILIFVYLGIVIIIIAMFLPLCKTIVTLS